MVTSAADLGDLQTNPNQIMHIYPYMLYLFENPRTWTLQCTMCFYWGPDVPLIFFDYFLLILPPTTMGDQC